jgi:hypothetical protein
VLVPATEKYFLWSAETSSSIFNFAGGKIIRKEENKRKPKENFWDDVWNIIHLNKQKKEALINLKDPLLRLNNTLQEAVRNFLISKDKLLQTAKEISDVIQEGALSIFQFKKTLTMIKWINEVH